MTRSLLAYGQIYPHGVGTDPVDRQNDQKGEVSREGERLPFLPPLPFSGS